MAWQTGNYAKLWQIEHKSDTWAKAQISTSRKDKETGEYETDFSRWVDFKGTANVQHLARCKEGDRIKLGDLSVTQTKKKDGSGYFDNFTVWTFEDADGGTRGKKTEKKPAKMVDDGEIDENDDDFPF